MKSLRESETLRLFFVQKKVMASRTFDATSRYDALITSYIRP